MGRWLWIGAAVLLALAGAGCGAAPSSSVRDPGPRLVQEVTLPPPTAPWQTSAPAAPRTPVPPLPPTQPTEASTPIQVVTIDSGFVFVTPTLPPSKTPTITPTHSRTPTSTPAFVAPLVPTISLLLPNSVIATPQPPFISVPPVNQPYTALPSTIICPANWFFTNPVLPTCPLNVPLVSAAAAVRLQAGYMMWIREQNAIYVLYDDLALPAWEVFPDRFADGMPERDDTIVAPDGVWQPKRGFGLVWRSYEQVQRRLGWALQADEQGFTTQVQLGEGGTIYIEDAQGGVFVLAPGGTDWQRYASISGP